ncbi:MAG: PAS domain S-box protein [bacterium]
MRKREKTEENIYQQVTKVDHYLLVGVGLGIFFWIFEALTHTFIFRHGSLMGEIFTPDVHEIWMRSVVVVLFIIFGIYAKLITGKRKRAELELWESEEKFRLLAETIEDVFWLSRPKASQVIYISPAYEKVWGKVRDSLYKSPQSFYESIHPEDRQKVIGEITEGKEEETGNLEYRILDAQGSIHWIQDRRFPIKDKNGKVIKIAGIATDVTERRKSQEELERYRQKLEELVKKRTLQLTEANEQLHQEIHERKQAEERAKLAYTELYQIFNAAADGMCVIDKEFTIIRMNDTLSGLFGLAKNEVTGQKCHEVFHHDLCHTHKCPISKILKGKERFECDIRLNRNGQTPVSCMLSAVPFQESDGELLGIVENFKDVTEYQRAQEELQKKEKLESIGILAGGIAHDLNNLLAVIVGNISLLELSMEYEGDDAPGILEEAKKACHETKKLTHQLLTFSRGGAPVREVATISELITDVAGFTLRGSQVKCEFSLPADLWPVEIDKGQMSQVINNLVINAKHAMPDGGIVKIRAENKIMSQEDSLPLDEGKYIEISIEDSGTGIAEEHIKKIFDPYFTTKEYGNGLGLATTYSIMKRHDGHITCKSRFGTGTTFHIYLPASDEKISVPESAAKGKPAPGRGTILVMDDQEGIRNVIGKMLLNLGYEAEFACDGAEAVEIYRKAKTSLRPFDAVILDLTIPGGIGGKGTLQRLLEIDPEVRAIASSGYAHDPILSRYRDYGFKGGVAKPYEVRELSEVLSKILS